LSEVRELCDGAVCSVLQAFYRIGNSSVRVDLYSWRDLPEMGVHIALDWHDESSCVKLVLEPRFAVEEFFTGGGAAAVCRPADEEFAMIDWCAAAGGGQLAAFFAPDLHSCDMDVGRLRLTVNRPVLYSDHAPFEAEKRDGWMDMGNGFRDLWIAEYDDCRIEALPRRAYGRLNNGESREITGRLPSDCGGAEELVPLEIGNEAVVVPEIRKNENGETEIILINYGEAAVIRMPDGEEIEIPAGGLTRYTVNKEKTIL
jgi:hypothetical protein